MQTIEQKSATSNPITIAMAASGFGKSLVMRELEKTGTRIKSLCELVVAVDDSGRLVGRYPRSKNGNSVWIDGIPDPLSFFDPKTKMFKDEESRAQFNEVLSQYTPENVDLSEVSDEDNEMYRFVSSPELNEMLENAEVTTVKEVMGARRGYIFDEAIAGSKNGQRYFLELAPSTLGLITKTLLDNDQPVLVSEFVIDPDIAEMQMRLFRKEPENVVAYRVSETLAHNQNRANPESDYYQTVQYLKSLGMYQELPLPYKTFSRDGDSDNGRNYVAERRDDGKLGLKFLEGEQLYPDLEKMYLADIVEGRLVSPEKIDIINSLTLYPGFLGSLVANIRENLRAYSEGEMKNNKLKLSLL